MARFFSLQKPKRAADGQQKQPSLLRTRPIRRLVDKTKNLFRRSPVRKQCEPFRPLIDPDFPETGNNLQNEIDDELLLLSERSSPPPSEQGLVRAWVSQSGPTSQRIWITPSSTVSVASAVSGQQETDISSEQLISLVSHDSSQVLDEAQNEVETSGATNHSSSNSSLGSASSLLGSTAELSVLGLVRRTWSNARAQSPADTDSSPAQRLGSSENLGGGSPINTWIDHVVDEDLKQDLFTARAPLVRGVYADSGVPERLRTLPGLTTEGPVDHGTHNAHAKVNQATKCSVNLANTNFFGDSQADQSHSISLSSLFTETKQLEDDRGEASEKEANFTAPATNIQADFVCLAQPQSEIELSRRNRQRFAKSLEAALADQEAHLKSAFGKELAKQHDSLEVVFDERHESSAKLHEIEMLNLQDDHEAEVKDLNQTKKDLQARLAKMERSLRASKRDVKTISDKCNATESKLLERSDQCDQLLQAFQERETILQRQTEDIHSLREELARNQRGSQRSLHGSESEIANLRRSHTGLVDRYNGLLTAFNRLNSARQDTETQLEAKQDQLDTIQATLQGRKEECEQLRARHDHVVAEKAQDFSWHVAHRVNPLALKPMNTEEEIAEATRQLRGSFEEQTKLSASLRQQLEATKATRKAKVKKLKRVVANQNQEKIILEMALKIAQDQRDHWAEQYDEIAEAAASKLDFSSFSRGLAERHNMLQKTRFALEVQLLDAKIRGDRAVLDREIRKRHESIKLEKRDTEIATLKEKLNDVKQKLDYESSIALLYKDMVDKEMPAIQTRNSEVERLLEDQVTKNVNANHAALFNDLHSRVHNLQDINNYWEHVICTQLQEYHALKTEMSFFGCVVSYDLSNARAFRNERDRLEVEVLTFRERFADELLLEPLVIPEGRKTSQQIVDDFKLESIDNCLLEQFAITYGAVPKELVDKDAPPWEHIQVDLQEDLAKQKEKWIADRDALISSFQDDDAEVPNEHEWIGSESELEAVWKGKGKETGEGRGSDGQLRGIGGTA